MAEWHGHAADCNSVNIGSIPFSASGLNWKIKKIALLDMEFVGKATD